MKNDGREQREGWSANKIVGVLREANIFPGKGGRYMVSFLIN